MLLCLIKNPEEIDLRTIENDISVQLAPLRMSLPNAMPRAKLVCLLEQAQPRHRSVSDESTNLSLTEDQSSLVGFSHSFRGLGAVTGGQPASRTNDPKPVGASQLKNR